MNALTKFLPLVALTTPIAFASTLCVNTSGSHHCYTSINDAINAAAPNDVITVAAGTYSEAVFIAKPLTLTGTNATVNASGKNRGIFIDGLGVNGGLSNVNVSGFTVENAYFEGILVLNASSITVSGNTVSNNDLELNSGYCANLDDFDAAETSDCGEGLHLLGVDHSVVTGNTVSGNAGGILLDDSTAATHDNLISFNTTQNNPNGSGITMASQAAAMLTQVVRHGGGAGSQAKRHRSGNGTTPISQDSTNGAAYGVYHNTIYGNTSASNGSSSGGSGLMIRATDSGTEVYSNVIVANSMSKNASPGITLQSSASNTVMTDNLVVGNTVGSNGPGTGVATTSGNTGINLYASTYQTGNMVMQNAISGVNNGVAVNEPAPAFVQFNSLPTSNYGIANLSSSLVVGTENYWGCAAGPGGSGCSNAFGSDITDVGWLTAAPTVQP